MKIRLLVALLPSLLLSGLSLAQTPVPAIRATVQETNGSVLVNQGEQFVDAASDMVLKAGDRIMAMEKSNASVKYFEGCVVEIAAGTVVTIADRLPCDCLNFEEEKGPVASLVESEGVVSLNDAGVMSTIVPGQLLKVGDALRVADASRAVVEYRDGCRSEVASASDFTIADRSPCACAILLTENVAPGAAVASTNPLLTPQVLIPAVIIGVCLAIDGGDDNINCQNDPASP